MALQGSFQDFGLPDILQLISMQRKTGVLTVRSDSETVRIVFFEGAIIDADAEPRRMEDRLGYTLVRTGRLTQEQLRRALGVQQQTLKKLGLVLLDLKFIDEKTLKEALEIQITQTIFRTFRWKSGTYHFENRDDIQVDSRLHVVLSTDNILMEGVQIIDEWPIIQKRIPDMQMVFRPRVPKEAIEVREEPTEIDFQFGRGGTEPTAQAAEAVTMTPEAFRVFTLVDGRNTVQDIIDQSPLPEFTVLKYLFDLSNRALIEPVRRVSEQAIVEVEETPVTPSSEAAAGRLVPAVALGAVMVLWGLSWLRPLYPAGPTDQPTLRQLRVEGALDLARTMALGFYITHEAWPRTVQEMVPDGLSFQWLRDPLGRPVQVVQQLPQLTLTRPDGQPTEVLVAPYVLRTEAINPVEGIQFIVPADTVAPGPASRPSE
ncbi:MAG: DUF4388 domain-containing protein [Acidobacteria bacterium]|nr:DUF4388 domain-containing protein [Acidobacteriota bacterium]MDW7985322.1 DUF4388 domain-containing protein [Acidobacteriota bacterium]